MRYKHLEFNLKQLVALLIYKTILIWLPASYTPIIGIVPRKLRYWCCRNIFKECGENVNVERKANLGTGFGFKIKIGSNSGIGINCTLPREIEIGENVMMGPNCYFLSNNHAFDSTEIPMIFQGNTLHKKTIIEDDVWIGRQVIITSGRTIKKGTIIAAGCVLTKDFPEFSIVGGNPGKLIRSRKHKTTNS